MLSGLKPPAPKLNTFGTEAAGSDGRYFGTYGLEKALRELFRLPLKKSVGELMKRGEKWCGKAGLRDDVSVLALEFGKKA
jgi:hypothetical protein